MRGKWSLRKQAITTPRSQSIEQRRLISAQLTIKSKAKGKPAGTVQELRGRIKAKVFVQERAFTLISICNCVHTGQRTVIVDDEDARALYETSRAHGNESPFT